MIVAENVLRFLNGEITWSEVEGLSSEQVARYRQLGAEYLQSEEPERALEVFNCLAAVNPRDPDAHAGIASALQAMERDGAAIAAFTRALELNPKHLVALAGRGELRRAHGDPEGLCDLRRAAELDPMGRTSAGRRAGQRVRALAFNLATEGRAPAGRQEPESPPAAEPARDGAASTRTPPRPRRR